MQIVRIYEQAFINVGIRLVDNPWCLILNDFQSVSPIEELKKPVGKKMDV